MSIIQLPENVAYDLRSRRVFYPAGINPIRDDLIDVGIQVGVTEELNLLNKMATVGPSGEVGE